MERVRELGGLHVVGSERHEARRIDNQLRGRAARQGDPGSSRFFLSLEDELMRLFGGAQVENLWKRIFSDESQPLEMNIIGRIVEQSQERVEGANFDVRKHLLEYDDVLNSQRKRIFAQRDQVFSKDDLSEDMLDMLQIEMQRRVPESLKDDEGPWKLLAYLEETQPPFSYAQVHFPSFTFRLLIDELRRPLSNGKPSADELKASLVDLAGRALEAEREHMLVAARNLLDRTEEALEQQRLGSYRPARYLPGGHERL
jgi:preprotein translocase subunit SecA